MEEYHLLKEQLAFSLNWKQAHLSLLSLFIIGLIRARSVNLVLVSETFGGFALDSSHYKRIRPIFQLILPPIGWYRFIRPLHGVLSSVMNRLKLR